MLIKSGKYAGKSTEYILLRHPDWAHFVATKYSDGLVGKEFRVLEKRFDAKPFECLCYGCGDMATRASAYKGDSRLIFWCDDCDPYDAGAVTGRPVVVTTIGDIMFHAEFYMSAERGAKREMFSQLATAKGCPKRLTAQAALKFFE